jgi:hypothetical protein
MRAKLTSFTALVVEVAVALGLVYWAGTVEIVVFVVAVTVVALLYKIMLLLDAIVSRGGDDH